eukprot:3084-Heterococcus_DN1.PRE.2
MQSVQHSSSISMHLFSIYCIASDPAAAAAAAAASTFQPGIFHPKASLSAAPAKRLRASLSLS